MPVKSIVCYLPVGPDKAGPDLLCNGARQPQGGGGRGSIYRAIIQPPYHVLKWAQSTHTQHHEATRKERAEPKPLDTNAGAPVVPWVVPCQKGEGVAALMQRKCSWLCGSPTPTPEIYKYKAFLISRSCQHNSCPSIVRAVLVGI